MIGWIILIIVAVLIIWVISSYNGLVTLRQRVKNAWSQIDVQLQRRFDLIPNLVETVKGYMDHEESVLTKVTELRTSWANASTVSKKAELDSELSGALKTIMAVSENYPDLKSSKNFTELQEELRSTEDKIAYARQFYNDTVLKYNNKVEMIPTNIVALLFGFKKYDFFEILDEERQVTKVKF